MLTDKILEKAISLKCAGKYAEAAESLKDVLDTFKSSSTESVAKNFEISHQLHKVVELLPELWRLAGDSNEAISSYRLALLHDWNLDADTTARIQKDFAIFLLYSGTDASPPILRYKIEGSFVPGNNTEEAILILSTLLRNFALERIEWDVSIIDHLYYALSMSGALRCFTDLIDELLPWILGSEESEDMNALNQLIRQLSSGSEYPNCTHTQLLASKISGEALSYAETNVILARTKLKSKVGTCEQIGSGASCMIYLEQRSLDDAIYYGKQLLNLEDEPGIKGLIMMTLILSARRRFANAEVIVDSTLNQTGKWPQEKLSRTKAKLQIAQVQLRNAVKIFSKILNVVQRKNEISEVKITTSKEMQQYVVEFYTSLTCWQDAEDCLSKCKAIHSFWNIKEVAGKHISDTIKLTPTYLQNLLTEEEHGTTIIAVKTCKGVFMAADGYGTYRNICPISSEREKVFRVSDGVAIACGGKHDQSREAIEKLKSKMKDRNENLTLMKVVIHMLPYFKYNKSKNDNDHSVCFVGGYISGEPKLFELSTWDKTAYEEVEVYTCLGNTPDVTRNILRGWPSDIENQSEDETIAMIKMAMAETTKVCNSTGGLVRVQKVTEAGSFLIEEHVEDWIASNNLEKIAKEKRLRFFTR